MVRITLKRRWSVRICGRREKSTVLVMHDKRIFSNEPSHRICEKFWRKASQEHSNRIRNILAPGLTALDHPLNTGLRRQQRQRERKELRKRKQHVGPGIKEFSPCNASLNEIITALDPKHPVYNFLIEYYGLKGTKGVRRLMKWPPGIANLMEERGKIFLEGATEQDFFTGLHAKGAIFYDDESRGVEFSPRKYVYGNEENKLFRIAPDFKQKLQANKYHHPPMDGGSLAPFLWYRTLLQRTLDATPILHCYGLHEWAMQYQPKISLRHGDETPLPPSSKYQSHLKLRVDRTTLNKTVEQSTLFCSHVDAWKFFAKEALPLNQFVKNSHESNHTGLPSSDERPKWLLRSEQPACVHTTMDLLKIAMKLGPFCEPNLFCSVLALTVDARRLDVSASPYDAQTDYGVDPISIETSSGRNEYKSRQMELMKRANPIRRDLLENYEQFLSAL